MPICSNSKFDWTTLEQMKSGSSQPFDEATSPTLAAIIRDIENLYLLLTDGTSDGQTGSPENNWQDNGDGSESGSGGIPDGYSEIAITVCDEGTPRTLYVLGKWA